MLLLAPDGLWLVCVAAEYKTLCPGGEGFRPNPITVILEGQRVPELLHSRVFWVSGTLSKGVVAFYWADWGIQIKSPESAMTR